MKKCLLAIALLLCPAALHAQSCLVVTPNGSGTKSGTDWNNAMAGLPHPLVRGATYFLADGTYPPYSDISVPLSGTSQIIIKKATAGDHCIDTGWNASTMGSGQAIFQNQTGANQCGNFWIANSASTGYITINGQTGSGMNGGTYGIKLLGNYSTSQCKTSPANVYVSYGFSSRTATHVTVEHVEMVGSCGGLALDSTYYSKCHQILEKPAYGGYGIIDNNIYLHNCTSCSFNHIYLHSSSAVPFFLTSGNSNITFDHDSVFLTMYTLAQHSEIVDMHGGNSGITVSYNDWRDVAGTAGTVSLNSGTPGTDSNVYMYGNVIWMDSGDPYGYGTSGFGDGIMACINGNNCPSWFLYQNTIVNMKSVNDGVVWADGSTGSVTILNNLWYDSQTTGGTNFQGLPSGSAEDYNSFLAYAKAPGHRGSHDVAASSSPDPFTNWIGGQFTPSSENANWNNRVSLPSGNWNTDAAGNNFTTSRGAYQYVGTGTKPAPPSSLTVAGVS